MDTPTTTTIALVGCAHIHTPGFIGQMNKNENVAVKYVYDHETARAEKRAGEITSGPTVVTDLDQILSDADVSAIVVCTETNRHEAVVLPAAAAKKNLFVEKPLGFAARDAYSMAKAIEDAGVLYQTGYFMRGDANIQTIRAQVAAGAFGKITRVRGSNCHSGALGHWFDTDWRWMADPKIAGVGAFGDLGTHALDILLWLMGPVTTCTAQIDPGTNVYDGCDETGEGILRFASGMIGTVAAAWDDVANPLSYMVSGTEGHAAILDGKLYLKSEKIEGADGKTPYASLSPAAPAGFAAFLDAITGKEGVELVTPAEAAYRSAVMEAMYVGAKSDTWVVPTTG